MKCPYPAQSAGITLLELMVVIAILAIIATVAVPNLRTQIQNNTVAAQTNEMLAVLNLAKSQAIRRNDTVDVNLISSDDSDAWTALVSISGCDEDDLDDDGNCPQISECNNDPGFIRCANNTRVELSAAPSSFSFNNRGNIDSWEEIRICLKHSNCENDRQHRRITILSSGQLSTEDLGCDDSCVPN